MATLKIKEQNEVANKLEVKQQLSGDKTAVASSISLKQANTTTKKTKQQNSTTEKVYGTGKRKDAIARVWLKIGSGKFTINGKLLDQYFSNEAHRTQVLKPFVVTDTAGQYEVICTVKGGGSSGQAGAIRHGISKALNILAPDFHKTLREHGLLTRDPRVVERKKYGKHKARKSTQFSKR